MYASDAVNPVVYEIPFASVHALAFAGDTLLATGLPPNLIYSGDGGKHWLRATIEGADRPFTSLAPSPNILHDGVVLAGTAGQGVMRSSDGGRYWDFVTFGLDDYNVLAVACAPVWNPAKNSQEIAIAATANGIYQSPNGGRAWRKGEQPEGVIAQSLCFSANFANDQTVIAGSEANGLLISNDGGFNWSQHTGFPTDRSVTALLVVDLKIFAATGKGELYESADHGQSWELYHKFNHPITSLTAHNAEVIIGFVEDGLAKIQSADSNQLSPISASLHRFGQLTIRDYGWSVDEPNVGRWLSTDAGKNWVLDSTTAPQNPIDPPLENLLFHVENGAVTVGADRKTVEVWLQTKAGEPWAKVSSHLAYGRMPRLAVISLGDNPSAALALGPDCHLLKDGNWQSFRLGSEGSPLTSIIGLPNSQIACATFDQLHQFDGESWTSMPAPDNKPLTALALTAEDELVALTTDGAIYTVGEM